MASVSVSHMVLFVASLVIAAGVVGTVTAGVDRVNAAVQAGSVDAAQDMRTDVTVISDAGSADAVYDAETETITLLVKNTGTQRLPPDGSGIEVLLNGGYVDPDRTSGEVLTAPDSGAWTRGDVLELTIDQSLGSGDHRVVLIVNGDEETFQFRLTEAEAT